MKIVEITKDITIVKQPTPATFLKGQLYLLSEQQDWLFQIMCSKVGLGTGDFSKYHEVDSLLKDFSPHTKTVIIHRSGGIGDLIALSSPAKWLRDIYGVNVSFITQKEKYQPIFDWFQSPVNVISNESPLPFKNDIKHNLNIKRYGLLEYEGKIEQSKENWFDLFYKPMNSNVDMKTWGRPQLQEWINVRKDWNCKIGILFTLMATANIRSIDFKPVYLALQPIIKGMDIDLFIHEQNITDKDMEFIKSINDNRIKVLPKSDLSQFLYDVHDATLVISTDTGALHFREGIGQPTLGIYNAFSSDCRCRYYQYVKTIDVKSDCAYQPCFKHVQKPDEGCLSKDYCLDMDKNKTLVDQLRIFFKENLNV